MPMGPAQGLVSVHRGRAPDALVDARYVVGIFVYLSWLIFLIYLLI